MDKNIIIHIETQKRYVTDIEIDALCMVFGVTFEELIAERLDVQNNNTV